MQKEEAYNENDFTLDEEHPKSQLSLPPSTEAETVQYDFIKTENEKKKSSSNIKFVIFIIALLFFVICVYLVIQKNTDYNFMNEKRKDGLENFSSKKRLDSKDENLKMDKDNSKNDKENKEKNLKNNKGQENNKKDMKKNEKEKEEKKGKEKDNKNSIQVKKNIKDLKVCVCTQARNENKYIREFVQFYEKIGVDKIFIYDNNKKEGEKFDNILNDYIKKDFVTIKDWRGKKRELLNMMDNCYKENNKKYDWLIFYSPDEFIHLKNIINIKAFLTAKKFDKCNKIYLNWIYHTDNNLYHYNNASLQKRFPQVENKPKNKEYLPHNYVKSIIRGNLKDIKIDNMYKLDKKVNGCNGYGENVKLKDFYMEKQDFENYYIDKYFSKSVDEFIEKLNSDDMLMEDDKSTKINTFDNYFGFNEMTIEKIKYIQKRTKLNLVRYINLMKPTKTPGVNNMPKKPVIQNKTKINLGANKNTTNQNLINKSVSNQNLISKNISNKNLINKNVPNNNKNATNKKLKENTSNKNLLNINISNNNVSNKNLLIKK